MSLLHGRIFINLLLLLLFVFSSQSSASLWLMMRLSPFFIIHLRSSHTQSVAICMPIFVKSFFVPILPCIPFSNGVKLPPPILCSLFPFHSLLPVPSLPILIQLGGLMQGSQRVTNPSLVVFRQSHMVKRKSRNGWTNFSQAEKSLVNPWTSSPHIRTVHQCRGDR